MAFPLSKMKYKILILILALFMITPAVNATEWWDQDWQYRRNISIENTEDIDKTEELVILTNISGFLEDVQPGYDDIRIFHNDQEIAYELFDDNDKLKFVLAIPSNSIEEVYLYYGNPLVSSPDYSNCNEWDPCTPLSDYIGLINYYKFDEGTVLDYSLDNEDLLVYGDTNLNAEGKFGKGAYLDGVGDYLDMRNQEYGGYPGFSFCSWTKIPVGTNEGMIFSHSDSSMCNEYNNLPGCLSFLNMDDGYLMSRGNFVAGGYTETSTEGLDYRDNEWHYLCTTHDQEDLRIFVDGELKSSMGAPGTLEGVWVTFMGRRWPANDEVYFRGTLDEIKIWGKAVEYFPLEELNIQMGGKESWAIPDLEILPEGILFSDQTPLVNTTVTITAFFSNINGEDPDEILVRFYNGVPSNETYIGEDLIQVRTSDFFAQTEYTPTEDGIQNIYVWVDPENEIEELEETNNMASAELNVRTLPDLRIRDSDIGFSDNTPRVGQEIQIFAMIRNIANEPTGNFTVRFLDTSGLYHNLIGDVIMSIGGEETQIAMIPWVATPRGTHDIRVFVDVYNEIGEWDESNNRALKEIVVWNIGPTGSKYIPMEGGGDNPPL
jgi:hypothetical protein